MMDEEFDLENPLDHQNHQMSCLFDMESDHIPSYEYCRTLKISEGDNASVREEAVSLITHLGFRVSPYLSYLAITYLDRFLSAQGIPAERKPWVPPMLAISCVSLALKMRASTEMISADMQRKGGMIFESKSIHRMELLILGVLKWRMRSVTPFCFMNFFASMFKPRDPCLRRALKARANDIIVKAQAGVNLIEYKPSIIAASALLSACYTLFPLQLECFKKAIYSSTNVDQEELIRCEDAVEEIAMEEYECITEKRAACGSENVKAYTRVVVESQRDLKRRKIGGGDGW